MMLVILFTVPVLFSLLVLWRRHRLINRAALLGTALLYLAAVIAWWTGWEVVYLSEMLNNYFTADPLGLLFFTIMTLVFLAAAVYSLFYFEEQGLTPQREAVYVAAMLLFLMAMTGVVLTNHLALLWVFVEATTLTSVLLIYFEQQKSSLEAAWKYIFICSIGIALAFMGIIVLSIGSRGTGSLFFTDLYMRAGEINPFWLKMAFAFILVGFGTKIGLAPLHGWLPDAHSEAPSPVSALLSGALLNSTFLGLLRFQEIMVRAHLDDFSNFLLIAVGLLSLLISDAFMLKIQNYKRLLAYSSIENMGILSLGIACGKTGIYAALLHSVAHSLAKGALFLTSGNILHLYGSKRIADVRGLLAKDPRTGWLWLISLLAIVGLPPFPAFLSKFLLIKAFFTAGMGWLAAPFLLFVVVIIFGMGGRVFQMACGAAPTGTPAPVRLSIIAYGPQVILLLLLLAVGISMPTKVQTALQGAAGLLH
jgi:hydrogenase-4 component F